MNDYNYLCKKTFGELYNELLDRKLKLIELGYKYVMIWEADWIKAKKAVKII